LGRVLVQAETRKGKGEGSGVTEMEMDSRLGGLRRGRGKKEEGQWPFVFGVVCHSVGTEWWWYGWFAGLAAGWL
jgi:hypothetical protein